MVTALNSKGIKDAECNTILNDWMEYCETIYQNGIIFCNMFFNVVVFLVFQCVSLERQSENLNEAQQHSNISGVRSFFSV